MWFVLRHPCWCSEKIFKKAIGLLLINTKLLNAKRRLSYEGKLFWYLISFVSAVYEIPKHAQSMLRMTCAWHYGLFLNIMYLKCTFAEEAVLDQVHFRLRKNCKGTYRVNNVDCFPLICTFLISTLWNFFTHIHWGPRKIALNIINNSGFSALYQYT